jgi:outer membrane putative beta-barrel porin/alpha-amylase
MRLLQGFVLACLMAVAASSPEPVWAQDLSPRAYVITPLHSNAVIMTYSFFHGSLLFDGAAPITGATGTYSVPILSCYHSFDFLGRSANMNVSLPYAVGNFQGNVAGQPRQLYRSGLLDFTSRVSVNLRGGPAMPTPEFRKWKQKTLLGVSLKIVAPTGQYDSTKLVNWGANRWAFKPDFGYSKRWSNWVLDSYAGAWFYTTNPQYYSPPAPKPQTEKPIGAFEGHLSYDVKPRLWFSLDGNFWFGGVTSLNGIANLATRQTSSRIGVTASVPLGKGQSVKVSYNDGAYIRFGGNYQSISVGWQYSWLGRPN